MKLSGRIMFVLLGASLAVSATSRAQYPWSGILSPSRATDWSKAGLPASFTDKGGTNVETTPNPWTPPTRTQYGSTIMPSGNASTDVSNINTALSNCPDGHYVLLGSGTFLIQSNVIMYLHSCTLRGSGGQSTTLNLATGSPLIMLGASSGGGTCSLTSGSNFAPGSTSVTCSGSAPPVGTLLSLVQCDAGFTGSWNGTVLSCTTGTSVDNGGLFVCGYNTSCMTELSGSGFNSSQDQNFIATSVSGGSGTHTVGLSAPIYMPNWSYSQNALLSWLDPTYQATGVGIEDLTILGGTGGLNVQDAYASWVKGVRFVNAGVHVGPTQNFLIANDYVFGNATSDGVAHRSYSISVSTGLLMLNNISTAGTPWDSSGMNIGNVMAYNYARDSTTSYVENSFFDHHAYSSFDLFEENETGVLDEDDTWGTHDLNTYFRNYIECWDPPYSTYSSGANARGLQIGGYHRFENAVGNAIGNGGYCSSYQSGVGGPGTFSIDTGDTLAASTLMRWGNVTVIPQSSDTPANSGIRFVSTEVPSSLPSPNTALSNPPPGSNILPASFFMNISAHPSGGTGLSWWRVCKSWNTFPTSCSSTQAQSFPTAGPEVSDGNNVNGHAYDIPAAVAWQYLPVDTTYQNSYTISSSSWASGVETLTFATSVLPSLGNLMGAFQLSGVNAACTTGATINAASEILMTGSSATTVTYALAANPGVSCTGTMKFPDVRQFDERVYQADPAATQAQPLPPSGAAGTVSPQ